MNVRTRTYLGIVFEWPAHRIVLSSQPPTPRPDSYSNVAGPAGFVQVYKLCDRPFGKQLASYVANTQYVLPQSQPPFQNWKKPYTDKNKLLLKIIKIAFITLLASSSFRLPTVVYSKPTHACCN